MKTNEPLQKSTDIDIDTLDVIKCPDCNHTVFIQAIELRKVPMVLSNSGKEEILQLKILICHICGRKIKRTEL